MKNIRPETRDAFLTFFLGNSTQLITDEEGRVLIPKKLTDEVGLTNEAIFVGKGRTFEVWNVDEFNIYIEKVKEIVNQEKSKISFDGML